MTNVHGSKADVFASGYVLSPFFNSFSSAGNRDTAETTTFKKNSKTYIPGLKDKSMNAEGIWEGEADKIDPILFAAIEQVPNLVLTYAPAGHELLGNAAYSMDAIESSYEITSDVGDACQISAEFTGGDLGAFDRGRVFHPMGAEVAGGNTGNIDFVAVTTTNGAALVVHATAATSLVVTLQDSADGSTFADLTGSITIASGRDSQRLVYPGTIRRYLRVKWTGTGTFFAAASRL